MLVQILSHTPSWVWGLFALLLVLGVRQSRPGRQSLARTLVVPLAMAGLSLYGTVAAFGATAAVLAAWCAAALPLAWALSRSALPAGTRYDAARRSFSVAGSWMPLALMIGIFLTKYAVGVALAMVPARAHAPAFGLVVALLYGAFSGCFFGRAARLWQLAARDARPSAHGAMA
ncbi:hypothetical protein ASF43_00255 [Pseudorhodoferax sp. Leaf267]|nr:DUF6622 family protein [Pseudorhodoferax sp. Leaf267]KQP22403.1 hypothetical protein ASF43_00255 [Pseudorhodoferax sp. Leaf267]